MNLLDQESAYFRARAEDEILAAECANHPEAARAHFLLAGYYLDLAFNPGARSGGSAPKDGIAYSRLEMPLSGCGIEMRHAEV